MYEECVQWSTRGWTCVTIRVVTFSTWCFGETFSNSFKKFISRRGWPRLILSKNGTTFTAELTQNLQQHVISNGSLVLQKLLGLVGSEDVCLVSPVKRSMKKTLRNSTVCVNELQILLHETALVLNTRFVYDHNLEILTTNHLLFGRKLYTSSSIQGHIGIKFILPKCVHQINMWLNHFWSR